MHRKTDTRLIRRIVLLCAISMLTILILYLCISVFITYDSNATPDEADTTMATSQQVTETNSSIATTVVFTTEPETTNPTQKPTVKTNTAKTQRKTENTIPQATVSHSQYTNPTYKNNTPQVTKPIVKPTQKATEKQEIWEGVLIEP